MKILHCSDIHLGRRPVGGLGEFSNKRYNDYFNAFAWIIETAVSLKVNVVLITGDLFDRKELMPEVLERTEKKFQSLKDNNIHCLLVEGNHDNITFGKEEDSWIIYLQNRGFLKRLTYTVNEQGYRFKPVVIDDCNFYGIGYPGGFVNETLQSLSDQLPHNPDNKNIILVHTAIAATDFLPGTVESKTIDLFKDKALYIAGGHFHSFSVYPKNEPLFFIPGSAEYWDLAEPMDRKGVFIFDTENRKYQFLPSKPRKKSTIEVNIKSDNYDDFIKEFKAAIDDKEFETDEELVFVEIKLSKPFYIDYQTCEEMLLNKGVLKVFIRTSYPGQKISGEAFRQIISVEDIEKEIISNWELFSLKNDATTQALQKLKEHQKSGNTEQFFETFDAFLQAMINQKSD